MVNIPENNKKYTWLEAFRTALIESPTTLSLQINQFAVDKVG
jgi:hypothetical protein